MEKLYIKNMVCNRCKMVVKAELEKIGIVPLSVDLGEVVVEKDISDDQKKLIDIKLQEFGFALIDDRKSRVIEKIKTIIIELVHQQNSKLSTNLSEIGRAHV